MLKIKVNDYIRTKKGSIAKICAYQDLKTYDENNIGVTFHSFDTDKGTIADIEVLKHSSNIIDLIEEGDIIVLKDGRKYEVLKMSWSKLKGRHIHIINPLRLEGGKDIFIDDIKSIVTKEQFKSIEYEI